MDWLKANLWEIKQSSTLRWFGFLLALSHLITFFSWLSHGNAPIQYYAEPIPMCWSSFENCHVLRVFSQSQFYFIYYSYPILAILSGLMFVSVRLYGGGWFFLLLSFLFKSILYFHDSRLSSNAHYLLAMAQIVYLLIPQKKVILKYLIVSMMVSAGILKLNTDWLSGTWVHQQTGLHQKLCEWIAALSTLAELIIPWFLVSKKSQNIVFGFFALVSFFTGYWFLGDGLMSIVFILFLLFYPFYYYEKRRSEMQYLYQSYIRPEASQAWIPLVLFVFWTLQALPFVKYQNSNMLFITEVLALEPTPSATECYQTTFAIFKNESREILPNDSNIGSGRRRCDPFARFLDAKSHCQLLSSEEGFQNIASSFLVRELKDKSFRRIFETDNICGGNINFRNLGQFGWNQNRDD